MVPTLTPAEDPYPVARAAYPTYGGFPPPYYHGSHPQQSTPDYQSQIQGRPSPHSQYPANWGGYGRGPTQGGLPPNATAYGSPQGQHRINSQAPNPYGNLPRTSGSIDHK